MTLVHAGGRLKFFLTSDTADELEKVVNLVMNLVMVMSGDSGLSPTHIRHSLPLILA
jgi:hypothetical protein